MIMNNKVYDILKWIVLVALPVLATLYASLGALWGWPYIEEITQTITAVAAGLGVLLGISNATYTKAIKSGK